MALTDPPRAYLSFEGCVRAEVVHSGDPFQFMGRKRSQEAADLARLPGR